MPALTERQLAADALHQTFLVNLITEIMDQQLQDDSDSDSDSDMEMEVDESSSSSSSTGISSSSSSASSEYDEGPSIVDSYLHSMEQLYSQRYLAERGKITKSQVQMRLLLDDYKYNRPEIFRSYLRITPECFDDLVIAIADDEVFHSNSNNPQMPVEEQVAITLYRFGHYGNSASTMKIALLFGVGYGTVHLVTTRVIKACCSERFRAASIQWPDRQGKEEAKAWVERHSCPAWRNGWLMVDGTLIPLFRRPGDFGNTYFDRKSNYSMNVQVCGLLYLSNLLISQHQLISTPNCDIIDYVVGLPGSQHDASAWQETRTYQQHEVLFEENEWIWADSAYPLKKWCQAPYKKCVCLYNYF
jgi:hypothetical protein